MLAWLLASVLGGLVLFPVALDGSEERLERQNRQVAAHLARHVRLHAALLESWAHQPGAAGADSVAAVWVPRTGLPSVRAVSIRPSRESWPEEWSSLFDAAENRSLERRQVVTAALEPAGGSLWLLQAGESGAWALELDMRQALEEARQLVAVASDGALSWHAWLDVQGQRLDLSPTGSATLLEGPRWRWLSDRQPLGAEALNADLVVMASVHLPAWFWLAASAWSLACAWLAWFWSSRPSPRQGLAGRQPPLQRPWLASGVFAGDVEPASPSHSWILSDATPMSAPRPRVAAAAAKLQVSLRDPGDGFEPFEASQARGALRTVSRHARRTASLIADIERAVDQPIQDDRLLPLAWPDLVADALDMLKPACDRLGILLIRPDVAGAQGIRADRAALEAIVVSLLDHAVAVLASATEGRRTIRLQLGASGCESWLTILATSAGDLDIPQTQSITDGDGAEALISSPAAGLVASAQLAARMGGRLQVRHPATGALALTLVLPAA
jgi:hypothetical protein